MDFFENGFRLSRNVVDYLTMKGRTTFGGLDCVYQYGYNPALKYRILINNDNPCKTIRCKAKNI